MRRFIIIEKHKKWLWNEDVSLHHDRDFLIVKAKLSEDTDTFYYRGFILFEKDYFGEINHSEISSIAYRCESDSYFEDGLPLCKNNRIFGFSFKDICTGEDEDNRRYILSSLHIKRNEVNSLIKISAHKE